VMEAHRSQAFAYEDLRRVNRYWPIVSGLGHWRIRISVRYTGPHLTTVLRAALAFFTDRQSFPAYDRRISGLM
jgi:hypothetical protein